MVTGAVDVIATQTSFCLLLLRLLYCFFHDGYGLSGVQTNQLLFPWWQNLSSVCVSYFVDTAWTVHSFPTAFPWWTRLERCTEQFSLPFDKAWAALRAERSYPVVSSCFYGGVCADNLPLTILCCLLSGDRLSTVQTAYSSTFVVFFTWWTQLQFRPPTAYRLVFFISWWTQLEYCTDHLQFTDWCFSLVGGRSCTIRTKSSVQLQATWQE